MAKIENPKTYTGRDLETIFFRPMLTGPDAAALGIKIMYNMPVPTTLQFWKRAGDILQKYTTSGWNGGSAASKYQKTIQLSKVKAEVGYSADDYFNMVYELITNRSDVNLDDLSGTELEAAETALFKEAIAESIRATMWLGDTDREDKLNTFDGFLKRLTDDIGETENDIKNVSIGASFTTDTADAAEALFKQVWDNASDLLKAFKPQGNLVYLVSSDIYAKYEEELDNVILESAYLAKQKRKRGTVFPRNSGNRCTNLILPERVDRPAAIFRHPDRSSKPRSRCQHRRLPGNRSAHVVQSGSDGKSSTCRIYGWLRLPVARTHLNGLNHRCLILNAITYGINRLSKKSGAQKWRNPHTRTHCRKRCDQCQLQCGRSSPVRANTCCRKKIHQIRISRRRSRIQ